MPHRVIILISLGLNLILGTLWYFSRRPAPQTLSALTQRTVTNRVGGSVRTNVVVRRLNFSWNEIESTNYPAYINNLRQIGCPESTIRDIIVGEVNEMFQRRRATEVVTSDQQWWRSEPDLDVLEAATKKLAELEIERRNLLTQLLGSSWDIAALGRAAPGIDTPLDGPILGELSSETKEAVRATETRARQRLREYLEAQQKSGQPADPRAIEQLHFQTRQELGQLLSAPQLEEYLLRYSQSAQVLRKELRGLDITAEEFRSIFRIRDPLDQQIRLYFSGSDAVSASQRAELEKQRDAALKQILNPERYQMFELLQDPVFRQAQSSAEDIGAPPEAVLPLYQINQAMAQERQRIQNDPSLTAEQRVAALETALTQHQQSVRALLGDDIYKVYTEENAR